MYKFIRKVKKSEQRNPAHYLSTIQDRVGWNKVFLSYISSKNKLCRGYYYEKINGQKMGNKI